MKVSLVNSIKFFIWCTFFLFVATPTISLPFLPGSIRIYDVFSAISILLGIVALLHGFRVYEIFESTLFRFFSLYVGLILIVPLLGLAFLPQAQIWMYLGDLRWFVIYLMMIILISSYLFKQADRFELHLKIFLFCVTVITWLVLVSQIYFQVVGGSVPWLVSLWYPENNSGLRYGFNIFRFAGPFGTISGLAIFGTICTATGFMNRDKDSYSNFIMLSGLFFTLASGSRTAFIILCIFLILNIPKPKLKFFISQGFILRASIVIFGVISVVWLALSFNIGRLQTGNRVESIISWISGDVTFNQVADRGGDRWELPLIEAFTWSPFGTLVNSSHALDLKAFDSYYIFLLAQAGPFIIIPFLILIVVSIIIAYKDYSTRKNFTNSMMLSIVISILFFAITQNTLTALLPRILLAISISIMMLNRLRHR